METTSLTALAQDLLEQARFASSGRAAATVYGGHEHDLRQTLIALAAGTTLGEHESPGDATLQVVEGQVVLHADGEACPANAGDHLAIPPMRHDLEAQADSVVLLTVAVGTRGE